MRGHGGHSGWENMAKTFTVLAAAVVGGLIDLGSYRLMVYLPSRRLNRWLRVACGLPLIAMTWIGVPVGEYQGLYRTSTAAGAAAAVMFFLAGFLLIGFYGQRGQYLREMRKLDKDDEDQRITRPADDSQRLPFDP